MWFARARLLLFVAVSWWVATPVLGSQPARAQSDTGDDPGVGADSPGTIARPDDTDYGLLILMGCLLIAAGILLVGVERWARRRGH